MQNKLDSTKLAGLYRERFDSGEIAWKNKVWNILCTDFFQGFIPANSIVLDLAAGYCEFINNITARKKLAVDINPDIKVFAHPEVEVRLSPCTDLTFLEEGSIDVIFMSNFLEHLNTKAEILQVLSETHRVCRPGGRILILQPNIRYCFKQYWDFFDHHIPLSDKSLVEALIISGFQIERVFPRFLPFTTKSKLPHASLLVKAYLKIPLVWHILGQQAFVVAKKG